MEYICIKGVHTMAKITIAGDAVVVTSALKLEDIKTIKKYRPKDLFLMGGDDGKEPVFGIGVTDGCGGINEIGASFGRESNNAEKLATITMCVDDIAADDISGWVADHLGGAIINLNKLEKKLPAVLEQIKVERAEILKNIDIVQ